MREIISRSNESVKNWARLLKSARERREQGQFLAEGPVQLDEALRRGAQVRQVLVSRDTPADESLLARAEQAGAQLYQVSQPVLELLSDVKTPQGLAFVCALPEPSDEPLGQHVLLLDQVRDPGNLGTMLRTADAFAMDHVLCCDTVDPYSPKAVRAAMGALFRRPITVCSLEQALMRLEKEALPLYATALHRDSVRLGDEPLGPCAIAIGNEAAGVGESTLAHCRKTLYIPMPGAAESLNAAMAAGIVMWEMSKEVKACP